MKKFSVFVCALGVVGFQLRVVHAASRRTGSFRQYFRHRHRSFGRRGSGREGSRHVGNQRHFA